MTDLTGSEESSKVSDMTTESIPTAPTLRPVPRTNLSSDSDRESRGLYGIARQDSFELCDYVIAVAANGLRLLAADENKGITMAYACEHAGLPNGTSYEEVDKVVDWDAAHAAFVAEMLHTADVFDQYLHGSEWSTQEDADEFGGVTTETIQASLDWFHKHWLSLWS